MEAISDQGAIYLPNSFSNWAPRLKQMRSAPSVAAVLGPVAGGPAGWAVLSHFSVMVKGTSALFASGPPVVRRALGHDVTKEQLGGSQVHTRISGTVDNEAESEADAFAQNPPLPELHAVERLGAAAAGRPPSPHRTAPRSCSASSPATASAPTR